MADPTELLIGNSTTKTLQKILYEVKNKYILILKFIVYNYNLFRYKIDQIDIISIFPFE